MIMNEKKITIADIARATGVSPATISRFFNHRHLLKKDTAQQIEEAMHALGISPILKSGVGHHTEKPVIVLNVPDIKNSFYTQIMSGATTSANAHNIYLLVDQTPLDHRTISDYCKLLERVNAIGTILLNQLSLELLHSIKSVVPVVQCCEFNPESDLPYVSINDRAAAQNATEHLISCGRNKIAFINGPLTYKYANERRKGFLDVLQSKDLSVPSGWMVQLPEVNYDMAYAAACQLLISDHVPNAFFTISDVFAAAVIKAAIKYGYSVPRDIMVVGFDNISLSYMFNPSITTISQPNFQEGYTSCETLISLINHPDSTPKSILLDAELIIRDSTSMVK